MKIVREHINEKFTQDSDPVDDLNIGVRYVRKFKTYNEAANFFLDSINILTDGVYESKEDLKERMLDQINHEWQSYSYYPSVKQYDKSSQTYYTIVYSPLRISKDFLDGYGGYEPVTIVEAGERFDKNHNRLRVIKTFLDEIKSILNIEKPKEINEKFTQESDPVKDLGIGRRQLIEKWIKKMNDESISEMGIKSAVINDDLTISLFRDSSLPNNCGDLPEYIQFKRCESDFNVNTCDLTTLRGMPEYIGGDFNCRRNKLKTLKYSPKIVRRNYNCDQNLVKFTKEDVKKVCKVGGFIDIGR